VGGIKTTVESQMTKDVYAYLFLGKKTVSGTVSKRVVGCTLQGA